MRWHATYESAREGEVSILAILETILAVTLVVLFSAWSGSFRWLALSVCLAPVLLLKTAFSTFKLMQWLGGSVGYKERGEAAIRWDIPAILTLPLRVPILKVFATVSGLFCRPLETLRSIPQNWRRVVLATDSTIPPEIVPGRESWSFAVIFRNVRRARGGNLFVSLVVLALGLAACVGSIAYRWSVKATSIVYLPLIFVLQSTFKGVANVPGMLRLLISSDITKLSVLAAGGIVAAFVGKLVAMIFIPTFVSWWQSHAALKFLSIYVAPAEIPRWQLVSVLNSILGIALFLFARRALQRIQMGMPLNDTLVQRLLGGVGALRWVLSGYTIICTGYLTVQAAYGWQWPRIGEEWFPWGA